ncbi:MAG TPA: tRNA dihydrouridine synthase DusB [Candidatus Acidoferrales bacterium]|nr:tRNA dihydrouridine synthase DusB [Candidatus Acidoferrales bacterium]
MLERYPELKIRDAYRIRPATVLAPMAGLTDTVFRHLIREQGGCGLLMTEFTSADGLARRGASHQRTLRYLYFNADERPIAAQLFGADPETLATAAAEVEALGFDQVDLNLGCPAKKVVKCGGSGLLRDLPLLEKILRSVRTAVRIPFTLKMRAGWDENNIVVRELGRLAEACGVEAIALHGRTREQAYSGQADWSLIAELKQTVRIPVIGNGDINRPEDAGRMFRETGCDAVMIGRAAASNPWIFRQMQQYFETGRYDEPSALDRLLLLREFFRRLMDPATAALLADDPLGKMKQFAGRFTHSVPSGAALRRAVHSARSTAEAMAHVEEFLEECRSGLMTSATAYGSEVV